MRVWRWGVAITVAAALLACGIDVTGRAPNDAGNPLLDATIDGYATDATHSDGAGDDAIEPSDGSDDVTDAGADVATIDAGNQCCLAPDGWTPIFFAIDASAPPACPSATTSHDFYSAATPLSGSCSCAQGDAATGASCAVAIASGHNSCGGNDTPLSPGDGDCHALTGNEPSAGDMVSITVTPQGGTCDPPAKGAFHADASVRVGRQCVIDASACSADFCANSDAGAFRSCIMRQELSATCPAGFVPEEPVAQWSGSCSCFYAPSVTCETTVSLYDDCHTVYRVGVLSADGGCAPFNPTATPNDASTATAFAFNSAATASCNATAALDASAATPYTVCCPP